MPALGLCCRARVFASFGEWGLLSSCVVWAPHCSGLPCWEARALERRLSSCGTQAELPCGIRDPSGPETKLMSPALAGGFSATGPPGKYYLFFLDLYAFYFFSCLISTASAAAAKSLQLCLTLCDPIDRSPPVSPVPGILQARILEWVAISFYSAWKWKVKVKSLSRVRLLATPWTAAYQPPPPMGFSRQEYWSGVPLPSPD